MVLAEEPFHNLLSIDPSVVASRRHNIRRSLTPSIIDCVPVPVATSSTIEPVQVFSSPNVLMNLGPVKQAEDPYEAKQDQRGKRYRCSFHAVQCAKPCGNSQWSLLNCAGGRCRPAVEGFSPLGKLTSCSQLDRVA